MKKYKINKTDNRNLWLKKIRSADLNSPEIIILDTLPWGGEYKPLTLAAVSYDDEALNVYMRSYEKNIRFEGCHRNDPVHLDSCMEFFFSPVLGNLAYLNFEMNPLGVLYTGFSSTGLRKDSAPVCKELEAEYFNIKGMTQEEAVLYNKTADENSFWEISYSIPFDYIKKFIPEFIPKGKIRANFYKCGDLTQHEHYIVWNNIDVPEPDYHRPEFFGVLEL